MAFPPELMWEQTQRGTTEVAALPDEVLGRTQKSESFADIMSQLSASRMPTPNIQIESRSEFDNTCQRRAPKIKPSGAIHRQPFSQARAVGDYFGMPGTLRHRDLTSWEQERAVSPERSWHTSSMSNVRKRQGGELSRTLQISTNGNPVASPFLSSRKGVALHLGRLGNENYSRHVHHASIDDDDDEDLVLTSVRTTSSPTTPVKQRRADAVEQGTWSSVKRSASSGCPSAGRLRDECYEDHDSIGNEFQALHVHRRRLLSELNRTNQSLQDLTLSEPFIDASLHGVRVSPGGGGGALTRARSIPSAGGPFAGRRTNFTRKMADDELKTFNRKAGDSYTYLGPGSDGPPLQEIHPLWT